MFKRTIAAVIALAVAFCLTVSRVDAAPEAVRHTKDDTWLVYWYICGSDLESNGHNATRDIAEMQRVKLPPNVKVLICAGGTTQWHHPILKATGDGIYLYSSNRLEKQVGWNTPDGKANMGNHTTLKAFLEYGEKKFASDRRIIIFSDHGGLSGVCYDDNFNGNDGYYPHDGLVYDELNKALTEVYGTSPEVRPFELVGFDACMTGSYELANSIADFSCYMLGSEPNSNGLDFKALFSALANDPSIDGAQIGKVICDASTKLYAGMEKRHDNALSVIDLTKMSELREAYEAYFDEAATRSREETGFSGAFARAAESRKADRYSNLYTDLGLLAKNTKSIMPKTSNKLLKAIDKAVVYNKRGAYLKSKGISTYYPYISLEKTPAESVKSTNAGFENIINRQNSSYSAQKELYNRLLSLRKLPDSQDIPLEKDSNGHFVANLTPDQLENISSARCILVPVKKGSDNSVVGGLDFGGAVLTSADELKVDWKKGTVTENFRAVEPVFDGHKIVMLPSVSSRGHTFYKVPIIYNDNNIDYRRDLLVRYDASTKKYEIVGFGSRIENGIVRQIDGKPEFGRIITPIHIIISDDPSNETMDFELDKNGNKLYKLAPSILNEYTDPETGKTVYLKYTKGNPFVYTRESAITNRQITRGNYLYAFGFTSPGGYATTSQYGFINVEYGEVTKLTKEELELLAKIVEAAEE